MAGAETEDKALDAAGEQETENGTKGSRKRPSKRRTLGEKLALVKKLQDTASACLLEGVVEEGGQLVDDLVKAARQLQDAGFALLTPEVKPSSKAKPKADAAGAEDAEAVEAELAPAQQQEPVVAVVESEDEEDEEGEKEVPRSKMRCATPGCPYLVHSNKAYGSYCCIDCFEGTGDHGIACERARWSEDKEEEAASEQGDDAEAKEKEAGEDGAKEDGTEAKEKAEQKEAKEEVSKIRQETPGKKEEPKEDISPEQKSANKVIEEVRRLANKMQETATALLNLEALAPKKEPETKPKAEATNGKATNGKASGKHTRAEEKLQLATMLQDIASVLLKQGAIDEGNRVAKRLQDMAFEFLKEDVKAEQEAALEKDKDGKELKHAESELQEEKKKTAADWRTEVAKARRVRDNPELPQVLQDAAEGLLKEGIPEEARQLAQEAITLYRKIGSRWRLGVCLDILAKAHLKLREGIAATTKEEKRMQEHATQALAAANEAVNLLRNIGHSREEESLASARATLAEVRALEDGGSGAKAKDAPSKGKSSKNSGTKNDAMLWREEVAKMRSLYEKAPQGRGDHEGFAGTLGAAALVFLKDCSVEEARKCADEAAALYRKIGAVQRLSIALDTLARAHLMRLLENAEAAGGEVGQLRDRQQLLKAKTAATEAVALLSKGKTPDWVAPLASARCTLSRVRGIESSSGAPVAAGDLPTLKRTFGYAAGLERPTPYSRFDIRDDVCLQVGGFKHGQLVKDQDRNKYVVIGVKLSDERKYSKASDRDVSVPQLWFQPKSISRPTACCFTGCGPAALKALFIAVGQETLKEGKSEDFDADEDSEGEPVTLCHECLLPLGSTKYETLDCEGYCHGECLARILLDSSKGEDETRGKEDVRKKARDRTEYNIGWRPQTMVPRNDDFLRERRVQRPIGATPESMYCLALEGSDPPKLRLLQTKDPEAAVNLLYLVTALQVRIKAGMAPYFSLDTPRADENWQVKTFGPPWLKGTAVGEVLFQADYHLKELSMGDSLFEQPVIGMKNVWDFKWNEEAWRGREWFVVKDAKVGLSENNVLIPYVKMGVEAREQFANEKKQLVDAPVTKKSHPLVKYAEVFSHFFDLIAERKSVVYHLREVSRAAIAAKFLVDNKVVLDDFWLKGPDEAGVCKMDLPFNKQERRRYEILVCDGTIKEQQSGMLAAMTGLYGGVDLNIDAFDLRMPIKLNKSIEAPNYAAIYAEPGQLAAPTDLNKLSQRELRRLIEEAGGKPPSGPAEKKDLVEQLVALRPPEDEGEAAGEEAEALECQADLEEDLRRLSLSDEQVRAVISAIIARAKAGPSGDDSKVPADKKGFWESLEDGSPASEVLKAVYAKRHSDRREDRALFIPPIGKESYRQSLQELVEEEKQIQASRRTHFLSKNFVPSAPGDLFPSAWKECFVVVHGRGSSVAAGGEAARGRQLVDSKADGAGLIKSSKPVFDKVTSEDGVRFRIYRRGRLEVRTVQEEGGEETVGAVYEVGPGKGTNESFPIVKATLYVRSSEAEADAGPRAEGAAKADGEPAPKPEAQAEGEEENGAAAETSTRRTRYHYFVVYETDLADIVVTEQVGDEGPTWEENPPDMEERYSRARVLRVSDCSKAGTTVKDLKEHYQEASASAAPRTSARCYAQNAFERAGGRPAVVAGPGGVLMLPGLGERLAPYMMTTAPAEVARPVEQPRPQPQRAPPPNGRPAIPGKASMPVPLNSLFPGRGKVVRPH